MSGDSPRVSARGTVHGWTLLRCLFAAELPPSSPALQLGAEIAGLYAQGVADSHKAIQHRGVILHDPVLGLDKQALAARAGSRSTLDVGLDPLLQHGP